MNALPHFESAKRMSAVELVRVTLRRAILRGDLLGGTTLVQTDIAVQLNVSTTPVREALRDLAREGIIVLDSHRKATVRNLDWQEMIEIASLRLALERISIDLAMAHMTSEELGEARVLANELAEETEVGPWVEKNIRFHSIFHDATRTSRLSAILNGLEEASGIYVAQAQLIRPELRSLAVQDHFDLIDAFERRSADDAEAIQRRHLELPLNPGDGISQP